MPVSWICNDLDPQIQIIADLQRSRRTQEASGARVAPLGKIKPPLESKANPRLFWRLQAWS